MVQRSKHTATYSQINRFCFNSQNSLQFFLWCTHPSTVNSSEEHNVQQQQGSTEVDENQTGFAGPQFPKLKQNQKMLRKNNIDKKQQ